MKTEEAKKVLGILDHEDYTDRVHDFCYKFPRHIELAAKEYLENTGVELEETYNVG